MLFHVEFLVSYQSCITKDFFRCFALNATAIFELLFELTAARHCKALQNPDGFTTSAQVEFPVRCYLQKHVCAYFSTVSFNIL